MTPEQKARVRALWKTHGFRPVDLFGNAWQDERNCATGNEAYAWEFVEALLRDETLRPVVRDTETK